MDRRQRILRKATLTGAILILAIAAGCYKENPGDKRSATNYSSRSAESGTDEDAKAYGSSKNELLSHHNTQLSYSRELTDAVNAIPGVAGSTVMLTDHNAYVAILIDQTATGTQGAKARRETDNTGTQEGFFDGRTGRSVTGQDQIATGTNSYRTTQNHEDLTHEFKQTIGLAVRRVMPAIQDVFISGNRDFVNQMNVYAQESWKGNDLKPYVGEFNATCDRIFAYPEVSRSAND